MVSLKFLMVLCQNRQLMDVVTQKDTERPWRRAFTGRPLVGLLVESNDADGDNVAIMIVMVAIMSNNNDHG